MKLFAGMTALALCLAPTIASAATPDPDPYERKTTIGEGEPSENLPAPRSDDDPKPPVAAPAVPHGGVVEQAGVGGLVAYGRAGVLELGGSASFQKAQGFTQLSVNPSIGWFFMDNVELSGILGVSHLSSNGASATFFSLLAEPSVHIPFSNSLFGFLGLGMGLSYAEEPGAGFALQPRLGMNIMVGRSGILTPAIYAQYSTHEALQTEAGTLLSVSFGYGLNVGYTVMW